MVKGGWEGVKYKVLSLSAPGSTAVSFCCDDHGESSCCGCDKPHLHAWNVRLEQSGSKTPVLTEKNKPLGMNRLEEKWKLGANIATPAAKQAAKKIRYELQK